MGFEFKTKPFEHQEDAFNKWRDCAYKPLFWDMGTGKTKAVIDFVRDKCYKHGEVVTTLMIVPNAATKKMKREFEKHSSLVEYVDILAGTKAKRLKILAKDNKKIFIINIEGVLSIQKELVKTAFDVVIVDESHMIKNMRAKRTKAIIKIGKKSKYRYILTGTAILSSPMDIFSQYLFLDQGETFGTNFFSFKNKYFEDANVAWRNNKNYYPKWEVKPDVLDLLNNLINQTADIRKKKDCLDLPPKVFQTIELDMSDEQKTVYKEMQENLIAFFNSGEPITAANALTKLLRLNQITSGFAKDALGQELDFKTNVKLSALKELLTELTPAHKVVVWCKFVRNIERLKEAFACYNPATLYGATVDKDAEVQRFENDAACRLLIGNPQSGSSSIDLISSDYVIYYSYGYNLGYRLQSEDRCHRSGSEIHDKITYVTLVCNDSIDEVILQALKNKENLATNILKVVNDL